MKRGTEYTCSPFANVRRPHSAAYRFAMKRVHCRSMIVKLVELYCLSLMEGFNGILDYGRRRVKKSGKIIDILDGAEVKRQQIKMKRRYKKMATKFARQSPDVELFECSLILTAFYDGVVNFKRKADSMWPLMMSVANCNPTHRSKIGVGLFLTILHNVAVGTGAEKYLLEQMFTQELVKLENGVLFTIPETNGSKERHVFLQARLVFTHLDTKALEKFGCMKLSNSGGCTLCNLQSGCYRPQIHKHVYGNTREALHINHVFRPLGQREFQADPANNIHNASTMARLYFSGSPRYKPYFARDIVAAGAIDRRAADKIDLNEFLPKTTLKRSHDWDEKKDVVWYHQDPRFAPHKFLNCVRFAYPDRRPKKRYRRLLNREYISNGLIARERRASEEALYLAGKSRPAKAGDFSSNSIHEVAPVIEFLDAFKVQNLGPDAMHMFGNANNNFIRVFKGERGLQDGSRELSYSQGKHAALQYTGWLADWECSKFDQNFVDAIINGFFIPPLHANDFRIRNPMKQRGFLKSKDHFSYLIAYASFLMSFTDIADDYVTFLAMYADDMCHLFDPCLSADSLVLLKKKICETRSTQEGLFPESEQIFIFHEIVDIVNHIFKFGHVRGLMCYAGERANGQISACITKGGVNYLNTLYSRYVLKENCSLKNFLFNDATDYDNCGIYSDLVLKLYGKSVKLTHFGRSDYNNMYKVVYNFLRTQGVNELLLLEQSPFYRLYSAYLYATNGMSAEFYTWLNNFNTAFHNNYNINNNTPIDDPVVDIPTNDFCFPKNLCEYFIYNHNGDGLSLQDMDVRECMNGHVYFTDLRSISECVLPLRKFEVYTSIVVKGIKFKCRGKHFAVPGGDHNNLRKCYGWKKHYACIARVKTYTLEERNKKDEVVVRPLGVRRSSVPLPNGHSLVTSHKIQFAWLNCAFRLNIPCDPLINGLALANCALRDGVYDEKRWQHSVSIIDDSLCPDRFVCLNYVDSSPIVSSAFNSAGKVLHRKGDMSAFTATSIPNPECYAAPDNNILAQLYLIPIRPERLSLTYENILRDSDHTLVFEHV